MSYQPHALTLVEQPTYRGVAGVAQIRALQRALVGALQQEDWLQVRRLDRTCAVLVDRVVEANQGDGTTLALALSELKGVYANLITRCQHEVSAMAV